MKISAALIPCADIAATRAGWIDAGGYPWLELKFAQGVPSGRWIRIVYRASYLDHLTRALIRFKTSDGEEWDTMAAPLFGRAVWIGRIPEKTTRVLISPVGQGDFFGFEIERVETISRLSLLPRAFRHDSKTAVMALGARLIHARQETRQALRFARGGVDMKNYAQWRKERRRPFDPAGLDAPRRSQDQLPHIRFMLEVQQQPCTHETPLVASLLASGLANWSLQVARAGDVDETLTCDLGSRLIVPSYPIDDLRDDDLVARLDQTTYLPDYALPVLAEAAAREPLVECFYGDEEWLADRVDVVSPILKPDWSPDLEAGLSYLGQAVFWRVGKVRRSTHAGEFETAGWRRCVLEDATSAQVHHIRRVLATCPAQSVASGRCHTPSPSASTASVSLIIPSKNQLPLLREFLSGLRFKTLQPILEILIVDNGSDPPVHSFYDTLAHDPRVKILHMPGPFNFSAMCNAAAKTAQGECLVFLNNDMSVTEPDWLGPLASLAMRPDVGAVGARLLFASGSIQHAGVVVGMGGYADHVSHGAPRDYLGYLGRLGVAHEVCAVTGACIAVEARKFHLVGGFDIEQFPVELNDIDLCLRLANAGWRTLMCPQSVLIHHQSATRGFSFRPFERYGRERRHFRDTWAKVIRDDPYFHPALSLFSPEPALDG